MVTMVTLYLLLTCVSRTCFKITSVAKTFVAKLVVSTMNLGGRGVVCTVSSLSCTFLSPVFFTDVNLGLILPGVDVVVIVFTVMLSLVTVVSGVVKYTLNTEVFGFSGRRSLRVNTNVISEKRITLVMTGGKVGLEVMSGMVFTPVLVIIVMAAVVTPVLLGVAFEGSRASGSRTMMGSDFG